MKKTLLAVALVLGITPFAAGQKKPAKQEEPDTYKLPVNPPSWDNTARPLPTPDFLQPRLDDKLTTFRPQYGKKLTGKITCTSFNVLPQLVDMWVEGFKEYYPNVQVSNPPPYSGKAATWLIDGKINCAFISRELKHSDVTQFQQKYGYPPTSIPVVGGSFDHYGFLDSIAFIVNKDNPIHKLTYQQLDAIFSRTRYRGAPQAITTWGQLGLKGEWADKPIHVYGVKPWNGFEEFVREKVLSVGDKRGEWSDTMDLSNKVIMPIPLWVGWDKYGISYSGMAFITESTKPIAVAENPNGPYYAPTYKEVALANYPLARVSYINVNKQPDKALNPAMEEFIRYILSRQGQQKVLDEGIYMPLREKQVTPSLKYLSK